MALDMARIQAREFESAERLVRIEHRAMCRPSRGVRDDARSIPPGLPDLTGGRVDRTIHRSVAGLDDAVAGIRLPIEVGRELNEAAETLFALPQCTIYLDSLTDVARNDGDEVLVARAHHLPL